MQHYKEKSSILKKFHFNDDNEELTTFNNVIFINNKLYLIRIDQPKIIFLHNEKYYLKKKIDIL